MPTIACSVGLTPEQWEKTKRYRLNRSAIARRAIEDEIKRIEAGEPVKTAPATPSDQGGQLNVIPCR